VTEEQPEPQPWDRRENETTKAFEAFAAYRNLGPARSVAGAAEEVGKSVSLLNKWCARHHWVARVAAWDRFCDQQDQRRDEVERTETRRVMHEEHARAGKRMWRLAAEALGVYGDGLTEDEAREKVAGLGEGTQIKLVTVGMAAEARARAHMTGRGLDPRDAERIADELIEVALRFVPEDNQAAFLSEVESFMLGA
jgi:hypothetical protein